MKDDCKMIEIPFEEYKELLEYKGRYLELKEQSSILKYNPSWNPTKITYTEDKFDKGIVYPYKVTCDNTEYKEGE